MVKLGRGRKVKFFTENSIILKFYASNNGFRRRLWWRSLWVVQCVSKIGSFLKICHFLYFEILCIERADRGCSRFFRKIAERLMFGAPTGYHPNAAKYNPHKSSSISRDIKVPKTICHDPNFGQKLQFYIKIVILMCFSWPKNPFLNFKKNLKK